MAKNQSQIDIGKLFQLSNVALETLYASVNLGSNSDDIKNSYDQLRTKLDGIVEDYIKKYNITDSLIGDRALSIQIYRYSSEKYANDDALQNKLSVINITECFGNQNLNNTNLIIVKTSERTPLNEISQQSVSVKLYNSLDNTFTPFESICSTTPIRINIPILDGTNLDVQKYHRLKNTQGIDIFNPTDSAFISRCVVMKDNVTQYDTTINFRLNNYLSNVTVMCSPGCDYYSVDESDYLVCDCPAGVLRSQNYYYTFDNVTIKNISDFNWEIFGCSDIAFTVN
jgi:hypothetical protein